LRLVKRRIVSPRLAAVGDLGMRAGSELNPMMDAGER